MFEPGGPLARALPDFEPRPAQRTMAEAVATVLEERGVLLAEAGTGTGKTLAYLTPAILSGRRVLVSTGTKNLQEQILSKDVPLLREALGIPFTATCMKGRANYLCLHRFQELRDDPRPRDTAERVHLTLLEEWARGTDTGDRAEIRELPEDVPLWNDVAATAEHCLGKSCPQLQECFVTRMRQRAAEADVVIVNHHLLCADAAVRHHSFGEVIPECHAAVIDEAHQLEDVVTQYFGVAVSNHRFDDLVRDGERLLTAGEVPEASQLIDLGTQLAGVAQSARGFFDDLRWTRRGTADRLPAAAGLFDERVRLTEDALEEVGDAGRALVDALTGLRDGLRAVPGPSEDLTAFSDRVDAIRGDTVKLIRLDDPAYVYFLETRGRGVFLKAAPIEVADIVRDLLIDRFDALVLTSATLAVNGSFDYVKSRLGVTGCAALQLPSEFDYARQAVLYLPQRMPDPRHPAFPAAAAREIADILRCTEGRAFVLFTSYATLREVDARLRAAVPYPMLVQGTAPRSVLLDRFRDSANGVLLATSSFWQGVDVVGEALSCVIIDKLPFASPADPVTAARIDAINARGARAFDDYQVPLAVLSLLQGLGRLLRHRLDRGVLAILDPRLLSKGYGRRFLDSLPPAPLTRRLADLERFMSTS